MQNIIMILEENKNNDRITIPLLKTLEIIFENNDLSNYSIIETFSTKLFYIVRVEILKTKSIAKLTAVCGVFSGVLQYFNTN